VAAFVLCPGERYALVLHAYWDVPLLNTWTDDVHVTQDLAGTLERLLPPKVSRVGVAGYQFFPAPLAASLAEHTLVDATLLLQQVARVKSDAEIDLLRVCTQQTDAGVIAFKEGLRPGADERDVAMAVQSAILLAGADRVAFARLLFSGEQSEIGIGFPRVRRLEPGDQVTVNQFGHLVMTLS